MMAIPPQRDSDLIFRAPVSQRAEDDEVAAGLTSAWFGTGARVSRREEACRAHIGALAAACRCRRIPNVRHALHLLTCLFDDRATCAPRDEVPRLHHLRSGGAVHVRVEQALHAVVE